MFEDLIKTIDSMKNEFSISIPIESDKDGYIDKQCPSENCEFIFKVNEEDWENIFSDESVYCPFCKYDAPSDQWFTKEQVEHAEKEAFALVEAKIHNAMISDAKKFNQKQKRNNFISMNMSVKGNRKRTFTIPSKAMEEMQLKIKCENCSSRFAVVGSAYFCPSCGFNSVKNMYLDSLRKITSKIDNIDIIRDAVTSIASKDEAELTCRSLIETSISDGVVAFQKYCEGLYEDYGKAPFNAFQRLGQGSNLWKNAIGSGYDSLVNEKELRTLNILFQKRHLLQHNEGIVDDKYINNSQDSEYKVGQRIVIKKEDVLSIVEILDKLGNSLLLKIEKNSINKDKNCE